MAKKGRRLITIFTLFFPVGSNVYVIKSGVSGEKANRHEPRQKITFHMRAATLALSYFLHLLSGWLSIVAVVITRRCCSLSSSIFMVRARFLIMLRLFFTLKVVP